MPEEWITASRMARLFFLEKTKRRLPFPIPGRKQKLGGCVRDTDQQLLWGTLTPALRHEGGRLAGALPESRKGVGGQGSSPALLLGLGGGWRIGGKLVPLCEATFQFSSSSLLGILMLGRIPKCPHFVRTINPSFFPSPWPPSPADKMPRSLISVQSSLIPAFSFFTANILERARPHHLELTTL